MANTVRFSIFYKARVIKAIVGQSRKIYAFGTTATGQTPAVPTSATIGVTPSASTLGKIAEGTIPFADIPTKYGSVGATVSNTAASTQLQIPADRVVHYIGLGTAEGVLLAYIALSQPDTQYFYEEQGTLTIPAGGYTVRHA